MAIRPFPDLSVVLELSASLTDEQRIAFARNFSAAVIATYRPTPDAGSPGLGLLPPPDAASITLTSAALSAACRIAGRIASLSATEAAYAIGGLYTTLLPKSFRAKRGIFYTPPVLVEHLLVMAEESGTDWRTARVLDPACGGGAFLIAAAERMVRALRGTEPAIILQNIGARLRGFDFDPFGSWLAQVMLDGALRTVARAAGRIVPAIVDTRDSLELRPDETDRFDLVVGNPPYGRVTLSPSQRLMFARSVYGHANLYGVFTDAALHWVKPGGVIAYVTPTSMLSGLYYKALRALLAIEAPPLAVNLISERDGVFADVLQETMLATYRKGGLAVPGRVGFIGVAGDKTFLSHRAGNFALSATPHSPWLLPRAPRQAALTKRLRSMPYRLADYGYGVSTGPLVWNRHKDQFREDGAIDTFPVIWAEAVAGNGQFAWRSRKRNHMPWFMARRPKDNWLIVTRPCVLVQRTTAKEQPRRLIAAELPASFIRHHQGVTIENHLNMVRTIGPEPMVSLAVISALLGSAAVDAAFRCINGSVAVSALELEELPLPPPPAMIKLAHLMAARAPGAKVETAIASDYGISDAPAAA